MSSSIEAHSVSYSYSDKEVLKEVTLGLVSGDFVGIVGPNGSGKTTLLRVLLKILQPTGGVVFLNQKDLSTYRATQIAQQVAIVPQELEASISFTSMELVLLARNSYQGLSWGYSKEDYWIAKRAMELTRTYQFRDRSFSDLSGGEKQRVIIAQALAQEPKILLLDEPTAHLDINHQLEILDLVCRLNQKDKLAVLAVFHDLNLATQYCKTMLLLKDGKIVGFGKPEEILTPRIVKEVFSVDVAIEVNPLTQKLFITPLRTLLKRAPDNDNAAYVHIVCGGDTGSFFMRELLDKGYNLSCGILNVLDTDQKTAQHLDIPHICEAPFSPISDKTYKKALDQINNCDAVFVTNLPFGEANLKNLELAQYALKQGRAVIIFSSSPFEERDHTQGKAQRIFDELIKDGAIVADTAESVFEALAGCRKRRLRA